MVYEFPELQGVMGREYALLEGVDERVARAIFEHYLPRFAEDSLPETEEGRCFPSPIRLIRSWAASPSA